MSPVRTVNDVPGIHPSENGGGGGIRTRVRRFSNSGSTCVAASIDLAYKRPDEQDANKRVPRVLTIDLGTILNRDPLKRFRSTCKGTQLTRTSGLKPLERSCRRWQLLKLQRLIYESHYPLDMHLGL